MNTSPPTSGSRVWDSSVGAVFGLALFACSDGTGATTIVPVANNSTEQAALSTSGLVTAYSFDEGSGTTAGDASGNGHTATLVNGAIFAPGHTGSAVSTDGINDYSSAGNVTALNGLTAITVSAWVKGSAGSSSPDGVIVAKDTVFALVVGSSSHKAVFGIKQGGTWLGLPRSTTSVDDGAFHFLTGVYDGNTVSIYVDGVQQASQSVGALTMNTSTTALQIGSCTGGSNCNASGEMWHGLIDDVRVYNRALSSSEIQADRDTPVPYSSKPNGSGGSTGTGGSTGSGGSTGTGGKSGTGGSTATGGGTGSGGTIGAGGASTGGSGSGSAGSGGGGTPVSYATDFNLVELPISENGRWHHDGLDWTRIGTKNGIAYGTQTGSSGNGGYDDSYAYLSGFPANQEASGTIHLDPAISGCCHEFAILLRWVDSAHNARGYECGIAYNGQYSGIVRWNGPYGNYTTLLASGAVQVHEGDVLRARAVGNVITMYLNNVMIGQVTDTNVWTDGNPGIGIFHRNAASTVHGFERFTATGL